ncbi:CBO0543 family protein [Mesobacillus subterraneus]|uniref:Uncharacterized protein n=1 Tax=Mesobacillus subterraneus TaxID=285983 RepID=A0A427TMC1_9BACI|nr:CBO0543 family protein [Mesobacillus subterraneus]RSD25504.1 hypothetical protein EJA10_17005 [Mesobacillus subterraneus]
MFHAAIITGGIILSIKRGKWHKWKELLPTFYYWALFSCFYEYIALMGNKHLWQFDKSFISLFVTESMYTFFFYPSMIILFLGNYPSDTTKKIWHYIRWISISLVIEALARKLGAIKFDHGWSMIWEVFFYSTMYPMLRLHYKKPLAALILSLFFVIFYLMVFDYQLL